MEGHTRTEDHDILSAMEKSMGDMGVHGYLRYYSSEILTLVEKPEVKILSVVWEYEFCNSRLAKFVAEEAMKFEQFGVVIWIDPVKDSSWRKLQMRIADKLGVELSWVKKERDAAAATSEGEEEDEGKEEEDEHVVCRNGALEIFSELISRKLKLLLIVDFVRSDSLDLRELGFLYPDVLTEVKFIFMARGKAELNIPYFKVDRVFDMQSVDPMNIPYMQSVKVPYMQLVFLRELRNEEIRYLASEMLVTGARDVADSLRMHHRITLEPNTILHCIMYLLLMPSPQGRVSVEDLSGYYLGEGLVPLTIDIDGEVKDVNIDRASTVTKALLSEIVNHTIFKFEYGTEAESKDIYVQMDRHLWEALMKVKYKLDLRIAAETEELRRESNCKWISLAMKKIEMLPPTPPSCPAVTTLLLYGNLEMKSIPDHFFEHMTRLRVLDLSRTALTSLPSSISCLRNCLRFIKLQNCPSLETLPHSFKTLESLQLLDLSNTPLSTMPDDSFEHMYNLRLINLSHTKISSLSSSISNCCKLEKLFLKCCQSLETLLPDVFRLEKLQVLDLSYASQLTSLPLPPSSHLPTSSTSLKKLLLAHCKALVFVFVPHLHQLPALEELDISECTVIGLEDIPFNGHMPNLRVLNMSESSIQLASLSLKGFLSLEIIQLPHFTNLEFLDLSNTKITEFPYEISKMTCLKRLDLVNTRQLKRVQWEKIEWLPQVLNWDQCGCGYGNFEEGRGWLSRKTQLTSINEGGGAFPLISVSNASIFKSLEDSSPLWDNCFKQLYIRISPCARQQQQRQQINKVVVPDYASKGRFPYRRVYDRMKEKHATAPVRFRRYLEMDGVKSLNRVGRTGIKALARQTELLWLHDNDFLTSLIDLDLDSEIVEECRIERCHAMHNIFDKSAEKHIRGLRRLWVSKLLKLKTLYDGHGEFLSLQHLHLWGCPNLMSLFQSKSCFPNLETLEIHYCPRLKCIYREATLEERTLASLFEFRQAFPHLHTLCLWDLRKLEYVCDWYLPALKKLKVGRCPKLQELPILRPPTSNNGDPDAAQPIEIQGESKWCDNIKWAHEGCGGTRRPINFKKVLSPRWFYNHYR